MADCWIDFELTKKNPAFIRGLTNWRCWDIMSIKKGRCGKRLAL